MSNPIKEGVNINETNDETHNLTGHELRDVSSADGIISVPVTSEEVTRQIKAATNPLTKQLDRLCDLMKELRQASAERNEDRSKALQEPQP